MNPCTGNRFITLPEEAQIPRRRSKPSSFSSGIQFRIPAPGCRTSTAVSEDRLSHRRCEQVRKALSMSLFKNSYNLYCWWMDHFSGVRMDVLFSLFEKPAFSSIDSEGDRDR